MMRSPIAGGSDGFSHADVNIVGGLSDEGMKENIYVIVQRKKLTLSYTDPSVTTPIYMSFLIALFIIFYFTGQFFVNVLAGSLVT
jgi:hypothetical protein